MTGCRIGKVKFKSGAELRILPPSQKSTREISFSWGRIFLEYDDPLEPRDMERKTALYMLEAAKQKLVSG